MPKDGKLVEIHSNHSSNIKSDVDKKSAACYSEKHTPKQRRLPEQSISTIGTAGKVGPCASLTTGPWSDQTSCRGRILNMQGERCMILWSCVASGTQRRYSACRATCLYSQSQSMQCAKGSGLRQPRCGCECMRILINLHGRRYYRAEVLPAFLVRLLSVPSFFGGSSGVQFRLRYRGA